MERLVTKRLILRDWKASDIDDLYEYAKNEKVGPMAGWAPHQSKEESFQIMDKFIEDNDVFAIELAEEHKVIGSIGIHERYPDESLKDLKQLEIGYVLNPKYWGNGYMPEAGKCVIDYCFKDLDLDLLWCGHYDFNNNSKRVIEKLGFIYRFQKTQELTRLDNKKVNLLLYALTKEEYFDKETEV